MLLTKKVKLKWNSKIVKHYVDLGYEYTKIGNEFEVDVNDLTNCSCAIIKVICDFCNCEYETKWFLYYRHHKETCTLDCCNNPMCITKKAKLGIQTKYGVDHIRQLDFVNNKIAQTNVEKYGCENPFGNKDVQMKIKNFYLEKYGVDHNMKLTECVDKAQQTSLQKYGKKNYTQTAEYRERMSGENNPKWKGDLVIRKRDGRELPIYKDWRKAVFDRDKYTCQCCEDRSDKGHSVRLEAHHIKNWKDNSECRYDVNNGITLCQHCHVEFHIKYGKHNNTQEQLDEFIQQNHDKKVC